MNQEATRVEIAAENAESVRWTTELMETAERLRESNKRLALLSETASQLLVRDDPQRLVQALCEKVMALLDCQVFLNFLVDETHGCLHLNAFAGIPDEVGKSIEWLEYGVEVCGCAARDGCRIVAEDIFNTPDPRTDLVKSYGVQAYACHPLLGEGSKVIGTLSFGSRTKMCFPDDDLALMKAITDQVATAMERKRASERERELEAHKLEFYRRTLQAATGGKLIITEFPEIEEIAGEPIATWQLEDIAGLSQVRRLVAEAAAARGVGGDDLHSLLSCVGEATSNAVKHAGKGIASFHATDDTIVFVVRDYGPGIQALNLPDVALTAGYSTAGTGGLGYKMMITCADSVYLATGTEGTAVAVVMGFRR